jgi:predicted DCC family thiol-disulfide oxidoreductase YuxK
MSEVGPAPHRRFDTWVAADPRALALFRIALATLALVDLLRRWPWISTFYSNDGVFSNHFGLFEPVNGWSFSLLWSLSRPAEVQVFFAVGAAVLVAFGLGFRTRLTGFLSWLVMLSVHARNPLLENGGDVIQQIWWLWAQALPLGRRFSVDAVLADLRDRPEPGPEALAGPRVRDRAPVRRFAVTAVLVQLAIVYVFNAVHKGGASWRDGVAISYVLEMDKFVTTFGVWLRDLGLPLGLDHALTWGTLVIEGAAPLLIFSPWRTALCRRLVLVSLTGLHLGIALLVDVGLFSYSMLVGLLVLLPAVDLDRLGAWARARRAGARFVYYDADCGICHGTARLFDRLDVLDRLVWVGYGETIPLPPGVDRAALEARRAHELVVYDERSGEVSGGAAACLRLASAVPGLGLAPFVGGLPGVRGLLEAGYRRLAAHRVQVSIFLGLPACGLPRANEAVPEAPTPSGLEVAWRRGRTLTREALTVAVLVVLLIEAGSVNPAIRGVAPYDAPRWIRAFIAYTRTFQSWSMFAPEVPLDDNRFVVDVTLADGTHVDPQTGRLPDFDLETAGRIDYGQFWGSYVMRLPQERYKAYRGELTRWLRKPVQRLGLPPDAQVRSIEVWNLTDRSPNPRLGERAPTEKDRSVLVRWSAKD